MLVAQVIGSAIVTVSTFGVAMAVMYAVNAIGHLRVSREGELYGLDLHEHGISAYPEYVISSIGANSGMASQLLGEKTTTATAPAGVPAHSKA